MNPTDYRAALDEYRKFKMRDDELVHWGISGMKWGRRRWQNEDGSLTEAGRIHYGVGQQREAAKLERKNELAKAKADAIRIKAQGKATAKAIREESKGKTNLAEIDSKTARTESYEETERRKNAINAEREAERNRHKESSFVKKLIVGGLVVGATAYGISKLSSKRVSDLPKVPSPKSEKIVNNFNDWPVSSLNVNHNASSLARALPMKSVSKSSSGKTAIPLKNVAKASRAKTSNDLRNIITNSKPSATNTVVKRVNKNDGWDSFLRTRDYVYNDGKKLDFFDLRKAIYGL